MDTTFTVNENLSTRYKMKEFLVKKIETTHLKLYYSTLLESLVIILLGLV